MRLSPRQQKLFTPHWFKASFVVLSHLTTYGSIERDFLKFRLNVLVPAFPATCLEFFM